LALISDTTVGTAAASVTLSSIPGTYTDLVIVSAIRGTSGNIADEVYFRLNGDSGNNYDTSLGGTNNLMRFGAANGGGASAGSFEGSTIEVLDYTDTSKHVLCVCMEKRWSGAGALKGGQWRPSTAAAVTSVTFLLSSGNIDVGSRFRLYGR
jgi:hypothetical protein